MLGRTVVCFGPSESRRRSSPGFLISTNGENFGRPDDAAVAKAIAATDKPVTFFCNYGTARTTAWEEQGPLIGAAFEFANANQRFIRVTL